MLLEAQADGWCVKPGGVEQDKEWGKLAQWWIEVVRKSRCSTASGNGRAAEVDGIGV